jgi:gliding motility-associated-like protein
MLQRSIIFFCLYLLMTPFIGRTQLTNMWYFGGEAAMSFNPVAGNPIPYAIGNSVMVANEGTASICDKNGQLLFYSNGETIYNKNHQTMLNGTGLMGHNSTFQGVVIVPQPGNDSIYYVFTADAFERNFVNGYRYSIVNINRAGGLGEVISKNNLLYAPSTERLTAARHGNGVDVWVITNDLNSNTFRSYLVNCSGLQTTPVISTAGDIMNVHQDMSFGAIKVSPDGKQICQTHFPHFSGNATENFFQLFDFNSNTGVISNAKKITVPGSRYFAPEFSPNSQLLYVSRALDPTIDQFEPKLASAALIASSVVNIPAFSGFYGLQIAPDNKIYATRQTNVISVISSPNVKGTGCNFELDKVQLTGFSGLNFPNFLNDIAFNSIISYNLIDSCAGTVQFSAAVLLGPPLSYNWDFGDGQFSTQPTPIHTYPDNNQFYTVKLKVTSGSGCGSLERSVTIFPGGIAADADFDFVSKCDSGYVRFVNNSTIYPDGVISYLWDFDDGTTSTIKNPIHTFPGTGFYNVKLKVITSKACFDDSLITPLDLQLLDITASPDQSIEVGQTVQLNVTGGSATTQYLWSPPRWLSDPAVVNPVSSPQDDIRYIVTATNDLGCTDKDTVFIDVKLADSIFVPTGFTPNNDGLNDDFKPLLGERFKLQSFAVYNRWGQQVFFTRQKDIAWNGKISGIEQASGTYVWYLTAKDRDGTLVKHKGTVVLIR